MTDCASGQRTSTAQVIIRVEDGDDLNPEFDKDEYRATIFEDSVEVRIIYYFIVWRLSQRQVGIERLGFQNLNLFLMRWNGTTIKLVTL